VLDIVRYGMCIALFEMGMCIACIALFEMCCARVKCVVLDIVKCVVLDIVKCVVLDIVYVYCAL